MRDPNIKYPDTQAHEYVISRFTEKHIKIHDIAKIVYNQTKEFVPTITIEECERDVIDIIHKRDYLNSAMIMIQLDKLAEQNQLDEPLNTIISNDLGVFGVDESMAVDIATLYGPIGITNFGYLDRKKHGIIKDVDTDKNHVNTFLDDLIGATVAAACGRISHRYA